jgi:hypothetical protein
MPCGVGGKTALVRKKWLKLIDTIVEWIRKAGAFLLNLCAAFVGPGL